MDKETIFNLLDLIIQNSYILFLTGGKKISHRDCSLWIEHKFGEQSVPM